MLPNGREGIPGSALAREDARPARGRAALRSWGLRRRSPLEFLFCLPRRHLCLSPAVAKMKDKLRPQLVNFKG